VNDDELIRRARRISGEPRRVLAARLAVMLACATALPGSALAFDLQGHRGARGLAPENTITAFSTALDVGVDTLELDVHVTRDGAVVVTHDPRLNPAFSRDAEGRWVGEPGPAVIDMTLAELQRHEVGRVRPDSPYGRQWPARRAVDGERVPTLAAVFEMVQARRDGRVRFNIETKLRPDTPELTPPPAEFVRALVAVIDAHGMAGRVTIQSFDWRALREVQRQRPGMPVAALSARLPAIDNVSDGRWTAGLALADHGGSVPRLVKALGAPVWSPFFGTLTPAEVAEARALGLQVLPWTVNEPAQMERMLDLGVDGLITDYPDRARAVMARRGLPLPPAAAAR
jgi:glycerophosphoryl diester phosphodiesterase